MTVATSKTNILNSILIHSFDGNNIPARTNWFRNNLVQVELIPVELIPPIFDPLQYIKQVIYENLYLIHLRTNLISELNKSFFESNHKWIKKNSLSYDSGRILFGWVIFRSNKSKKIQSNSSGHFWAKL